MNTKMRSFRLPDEAWDLLGVMSERISERPPAKKGRSSVVLALLEHMTPQNADERALYWDLFGHEPPS